jgi:hypothetical protein
MSSNMSCQMNTEADRIPRRIPRNIPRNIPRHIPRHIPRNIPRRISQVNAGRVPVSTVPMTVEDKRVRVRISPGVNCTNDCGGQEG